MESRQPLISVCHATCRPQQAINAFCRHQATCKGQDWEYIVACDGTATPDELLKMGQYGFTVVVLPFKDGGVNKWNAAAAKARGKILMEGQDDFHPPIFWDDLLAKAADWDKEVALWVDNGEGNRPPHRVKMLEPTIISRARYERLGYFYHPAFTHLYADDWHTHVSWRDGVVVDRRDTIRWMHKNPLRGHGQPDEITKRTNAPAKYQEGQRILQQLMAAENAR